MINPKVSVHYKTSQLYRFSPNVRQHIEKTVGTATKFWQEAGGKDNIVFVISKNKKDEYDVTLRKAGFWGYLGNLFKRDKNHVTIDRKDYEYSIEGDKRFCVPLNSLLAGVFEKLQLRRQVEQGKKF